LPPRVQLTCAAGSASSPNGAMRPRAAAATGPVRARRRWWNAS